MMFIISDYESDWNKEGFSFAIGQIWSDIVLSIWIVTYPQYLLTYVIPVNLCVHWELSHTNKTEQMP